VIVRAPELMHGKASDIHHDGSGVFDGLPTPFSAIRYHSLCAAPASVPRHVARHRSHPIGRDHGHPASGVSVHGVQFHPESILSEHGKALLANFLNLNVRAQRPTVSLDVAA